MKKKIVIILALFISMVTMTACSYEKQEVIVEEQIESVSTKNGKIIESICDGQYVTNVREETILIPGLEEEYSFLYLADLHIMLKNEEIAEEDIQTMEDRYQLFLNSNGKSPEEMYTHLSKVISKTELDGVLLGGDMLDYLSQSNWEFFKQGLEEFSKPYLFATADHDVSAWWTKYNSKEKKALKKSMELKIINTLEFDDFIILSISENTSQLKKAALKQIKEVFAIGKPIVIVTHVPFESTVDTGLVEASKVIWGGRSLLWGENSYYVPNEITQEFIDMLHEENTPVVAVLTGHLHFEYIGMLNENVKQYVFNPAYTGEVVLFTIKGSK